MGAIQQWQTKVCIRFRHNLFASAHSRFEGGRRRGRALGFGPDQFATDEGRKKVEGFECGGQEGAKGSALGDKGREWCDFVLYTAVRGSGIVAQDRKHAIPFDRIAISRNNDSHQGIRNVAVIPPRQDLYNGTGTNVIELIFGKSCAGAKDPFGTFIVFVLFFLLDQLQ